MKLDDEVIEIGPMDAIRIAPHVTRAFEAGPDGLELLVFGPHHARDAEIGAGTSGPTDGRPQCVA